VSREVSRWGGRGRGVGSLYVGPMDQCCGSTGGCELGLRGSFGMSRMPGFSGVSVSGDDDDVVVLTVEAVSVSGLVDRSAKFCTSFRRNGEIRGVVVIRLKAVRAAALGKPWCVISAIVKIEMTLSVDNLIFY